MVVVEAGAKPIVRTQMTSETRLNESARTFEAQLEDGRWLHISERRTNDGGFVSVGTDITALKRHEETIQHLSARAHAGFGEDHPVLSSCHAPVMA